MNRTSHNLISTLLLLIATVILFVSEVHAQVVLAPTAVYMSDQQRTTTFLVVNNTTEDKDVVLKFQFGYPVTDTNGSTRVDYSDSAMARKYSCSEWVSMFPRKFRLVAGARQLVRITARMPVGLDDGMYWTRLVTTTSAAVAGETTDQVGARLNLSVHQVVPVMVKVGKPLVKLESARLKIVRGEDATLSPALAITASGNGPFIGTAKIQLTRANEDPIVRELPLSVYFSTVKRLADALPPLTAGTWNIALRLTPGKQDVDMSFFAEADPLETTATIEVGSQGDIVLR